MANHLIIGLGGTGGKILRAFRKRVYEEFGSNEPDSGTNLEYLYVDSDVNDLNNKSSWTYMGNPVHLQSANKVNIHGLANGIMQNLDQYPGMRAFINNNDSQLMLDSQVQAIVSTGIGGQRRRFGRMLMSNNIINASDDKFTKKLENKILSMSQHTGDSSITYHVCAGLAGGTGSGSIVDVLAQISKVSGNMSPKVFLYLYLPERLVSNTDDAGYYQSNGYAALLELNSMSIGNYNPVDVSGEIDYVTGKVKRLLKDMSPYTLAYLFTNENESNQVLEKKAKLPAAVADFMFQLLMGNGGRENAQLSRVFLNENFGAAAEKNELNENVHSRDFATFGIKRIIYPESEIREYASEKNSESTLCGLVYNKWVNHMGFSYESEEDASMGIAADVRKPNVQKAMWLDYDHLTMQTPIEGYEASRDWNTFEEYWSNVCSFFEGDVLEKKVPRQQMISRFLEFTDPEYTSNFRNLGVTRFFSAMKMQRELKNYAAVICRHIEWTFFDELINGIHGETPMSLQKARVYVMELEKAVRERLAKVPDQKSALSDEISKIQTDLDRIQKELNDIGVLGGMLGRVNRIFSNWALAKKDYYVAATKKVAADYAECLMTEIAGRLHIMANNLTLIQNLFNEAQACASIIANNSCSLTEGEAGSVQVVDKRYDPDSTKRIVESLLLSDEALQEDIKRNTLHSFKTIATQSTNDSPFRAVYEAMGGSIPANDNTPFRSLASIVNRDNGGDITFTENPEIVLKYISDRSYPSITDKLNKEAANDDSNKLLGMNILERIRQEFPTDQQLEGYVTRLYNSAKNFLRFEAAETGLAPAGQSVPRVQSVVVVVLPPYDDERYRNKFIAALRGQFGDLIPDVDGIIEGSKPNEIVIMSGKGGFPLRFIENVKIMRDKYEGLVSKHNPGSKLNRVLLHTESLDADKMPSLYNDDNRRAKNVITALKLYTIPGLIEDAEDPETGNPIRVVNVGTRMEEENYNVGQDFISTVNMLSSNAQAAGKIMKHVNSVFADLYRSSNDKRNYISTAENYLFDVILPLCGGNKLNPEFKEYKSIINDFFKSLN